MTCLLDRPSQQELYDRIKGNFEANVLGGYEIVPESNEFYLIANDYAMHEAFYSIAEQQYKARDPRFACCSDLFDMAALNGFFPKSASFAQGYVRISGTAAAIVPNPIQITVGDQTFVVVGTPPSSMPTKGYFDARVQAITPGPDGNITIRNKTASLATSAAGIDNEVELVGSTFCGGAAAESCEEFRSRYLDGLAYQQVGNEAWIINKIKEWPCVTRVFRRGGSCCIPKTGNCGCENGCNSCSSELAFYPLFDDTYDCGIPPECIVEEMEEWLFGDPPGLGRGQAPIGICGKLIAPEASVIDVYVSGLSCATSTQLRDIRRRIRDLFSQAAPSEFMSLKSIELAVAQVVGISFEFEVRLEDTTGNMTFTPCGDLDPACNILPCLGDITFVGTDVGSGRCA